MRSPSGSLLGQLSLLGGHGDKVLPGSVAPACFGVRVCVQVTPHGGRAAPEGEQWWCALMGAWVTIHGVAGLQWMVLLLQIYMFLFDKSQLE